MLQNSAIIHYRHSFVHKLFFLSIQQFLKIRSNDAELRLSEKYQNVSFADFQYLKVRMQPSKEAEMDYSQVFTILNSLDLRDSLEKSKDVTIQQNY